MSSSRFCDNDKITPCKMIQNLKNSHIYLVYPRAYKNSGSTTMRVFQTHEMICDHLSHTFKASTTPVSNLRFGFLWRLWVNQFAPDSCIIFCKNAIDRVPKQQIYNLKKRGMLIALDYIDRDMSNIYSFVDLHIASSHRQELFLRSLGFPKEKVVFWEHAADYRIQKYKFNCNQNNGKIFYLGELSNAYIPSELLSEIDVISYSDSISLNDLRRISTYKFQYCIRPRIQNQNLSVIKPLTKVMNSIALSIPPIISNDMDEAVGILGRDYPFIINTNDKHDFYRILSLAKSSHQAYKNARNIIKKLQYPRSIENTALKFHDIFAHR